MRQRRRAIKPAIRAARGTRAGRRRVRAARARRHRWRPGRRASGCRARRRSCRPIRRRYDPPSTSDPSSAPAARASANSRATPARALHRRPREAAADLEGRARQMRRQRREGGVDPIGVGERRRADVDACASLAGDDVRTRCRPLMTPTLTETPRSRSCSVSIGRTWRASSRMALTPLPGSTPACAGCAADDDVVLAAALAAGFERAAGQRRLEHQHGVAAPGFGFDQRARGVAARLLVGRPQHDDRGRRRGGASANSARVASMPSEIPAFMSNMPGPRADRRRAERHACELSDRPDRVEVAEQQDLARRRRRTPRADGRPPRLPRRRVIRAAQRRQTARQLHAAAIDGGFVVGRRFEPDQRLDGVDEPALLRPGSSREVAARQRHGRVL